MKYDTIASKESVKKVMEAVKPRGISPESVNMKEDALRRLNKLIPSGAEVMTGGSTTLKEIGFVGFLPVTMLSGLLVRKR